MSKHILQRGPAGAPVVVVYFVGQHMFGELVAAVGQGVTIIAYDARVTDPIPSLAADAITSGSTVLVGYSEGCSTVRTVLTSRVLRPHGVIAIDGTHANLPPLPWQIEVWKDLADDARAGKRLFVATCTQQTYVETDLPAGKRYMSTVSVLEQATGWWGKLRGVGATHVEFSEGNLHVLSYPSATCDEAAHIHQQRFVLPLMLRRYLRPWLERQASEQDAPCELDEGVRAQASAAVAGSLRALADGLDHGPKGDA